MPLRPDGASGAVVGAVLLGIPTTLTAALRIRGAATSREHAFYFGAKHAAATFIQLSSARWKGVVGRAGAEQRVQQPRGASEVEISTDLAEEEAAVGGDAGGAPSRSRSRGRGRTALVLVLGLLVGVAAAVVVPRILDRDEGTGAAVPAAQERTLDGDEVITSPEDLLPDGVEVPPGAGAQSPEAALTGFLDAEVAKDFETSFGFLSSTDRIEFGSPAGWVAGHADVLPPVLAYEPGEVSQGDGVATVVTTVTFEPGLDQVVGLTPGQARVAWEVLEAEDGSWGVSLDTSAVEPIYPPAEGAGAAARTWVDDRQACTDPANEREGLVGAAPLADTLCGAEGELSLGEVSVLDEAATATISTAFGPETAAASRAVRITGSVELAAVLAPIGDEWFVIGVLP